MLPLYALLLQSPSIHLEISGERLETAGPKIARALGIENVVVNPKLENQLVMISVKNVSREEFVRQFEKAMNMSFVKRTEGWWLSQSPDQQIAEEKAERDNNEKKIESALQSAREYVGSQGAFNDNEAAKLLKDLDANSPKVSQQDMGFSFTMPDGFSKNQARTPTSRFMHRVIARLKNFHFNGLTDANPRVVFSTQPTAMQKPFPFDVSDLVQQLTVESEIWNTAIEDKKAKQPKSEPKEGLRAIVNFSGASGTSFEIGENGEMLSSNRSAKPIRGRDIQCMTLAVSIRDTPTFNVTVYGKNDEVVIGSSFPDFNDLKSSKDQAEFGLKPEPIAGSNSGKKEPWLEFASAFRKVLRFEGAEKLSAPLFQQLLNPEIKEVSAHSLAPLLKQSLGDRNLIAALDDSMLGAMSVDLKAKHPLTALSFFDILNSAEITDQWAIRKLLNPRPLRNAQVDRKKLGNYLRFYEKNRRELTLEEEAGFVYGLPWIPNPEQPYSVYKRLMNFDIPEMSYKSNEVSALRIYGSLSATERELAKKTGIPLNQLNSSAQRELYRAIFYPDYPNFFLEPAFTPGVPEGNGRGMRGIAPAMSEFVIYGGSQSRSPKAPSKYSKAKMFEPTFALPNGLLPGMKFVMSESSSPVILNGAVKKSTAGTFIGGMEPMSFGMMLQRQKNPNLGNGLFSSKGSDMGLDENRIYIGRSRFIQFGIVMTDEPMMKRWNLDRDALEDKKLYSVDSLPTSMKEQVMNGMKMATESGNSRIFRSGGGSKLIPPQ